MKKWTMAILLFDLMAGLLFLGLWEQQRGAEVGEKAVTTSAQGQDFPGKTLKDGRGPKGRDADEGEKTDLADGAVGNQAEDVKKIALTFDDEVIIGLSQEISYIRSRFYDLVLF